VDQSLKSLRFQVVQRAMCMLLVEIAADDQAVLRRRRLELRGELRECLSLALAEQLVRPFQVYGDDGELKVAGAKRVFVWGPRKN